MCIRITEIHLRNGINCKISTLYIMPIGTCMFNTQCINYKLESLIVMLDILIMTTVIKKYIRYF